MEAAKFEQWPNTAPPGYVLRGKEYAQRMGAYGPVAPPVELSAAWREHRSLEAEAGRRAAEVPQASARREKLVAYLLKHFGGVPPRGWTVQTFAAVLELDRTTLTHWLRNPDRFAAALALPSTHSAHRSDDMLERMICALATGPIIAKPLTSLPPVVPAVLGMRHFGGRRILVLRGTGDALASLRVWADRELDATGRRVGFTSGNNSRLEIEGPADLLLAMRTALLALERWQTLTPTSADVDTWLAAGVP